MKIVLLGYGMENQSAERFLRDLPKGVDSIYGYSREELRQADYEIIPEVDGEIEVEGDLIVRTPSLPPWFVKTKGRVTSATKIFYEVFPRERIIGVTGTKGKGTTCTIIEALMRARGLGAEIVGNIGKPALDYVRDHKLGAFAIYETSSFQAWDATESPERAVLLRVESEHLDKHETLMDYFEAKKNLVRFQEEGDLAVVFGGNKIDVSDISATVVKYPGEFRVRDGWFYKGEQKLVEASELRLEGEHNQENALAALAVTWEIICRPHSQHQKCDFDVATKEPAASATPMTNDVIDVIKKAFNGLKSLPHRMENLGLIGGVEVIDDNFSASMPSLDVATKTLSDANKKYVLIAGGFDRGLGNYHEIAEILEREYRKGFLQKVFLIGQIAPKVAELLPREVEYEIMPNDFEVTVRAAFELARAERAVLLMSPGAPSFDMFNNFTERAERFQGILREIGDFRFLGYEFDKKELKVTFRYNSGGVEFGEKITFARNENTDEMLRKYPKTIDRALSLGYMIIGTSYYKAFPSRTVRFEDGQKLDEFQARFLDSVYQEGLSEFAYKNKLRRDELAHFAADGEAEATNENYEGKGVLSLQSGGKDSLLMAKVLIDADEDWQPLFIDINGVHPRVLDDLGKELLIMKREVDFEKLKEVAEMGGMNGHVPITLALTAISITQAILLGKNEIMYGAAHEGEEAHDVIKSANDEPDLLARHQWSKTFIVEKTLQEWVGKYISPNIKVGSILRQFSEMKTIEEFVRRAWKDYGHRFSSCNRANYHIGANNRELRWCGNCPKCANMFLMMAPFLPTLELKKIFGGQDLLAKESLMQDFKGLFGIDGVIKPFECVGEIDELRLAYKMARARHGADLAELPFGVPEPDAKYDYKNEYAAQEYFVKRSRKLFDASCEVADGKD